MTADPGHASSDPPPPGAPAADKALEAFSSVTNEWARLNREAQKQLRTTERLAQQAIQTSEHNYRQLYENLRDAFARTDLRGRFLECNPAFEDLLGYSMEELRELTDRDLTPERWHPDDARLAREQLIPLGHTELYEKEYRRKDGTVLPVNLRWYRYEDGAGQTMGYWGLIRDITEAKRLERELKLQLDLHTAFRETNEVLLRGEDREALCQGVCSAVVRSGLFNLAWVAVPGPERLRVLAAAGPARAYLDGLDMPVDPTFPFGRGPSMTALRTGQIQVNPDFSAPAMAPWSRQAQAHGLGSSASMLIREVGRTMGVFNLYSPEPGFFTQERMTHLVHMAGSLSRALDLEAAEGLRRNLEALKAKSEIAAYIAHEINNPLAGIKQSFQVIAMDIPEEHPDRPFVAIISRELDRIASIIRMAYSIHRPGMPQVRQTSVPGTLADLAGLLRTKLRARKLTLELSEDPACHGRLHEDILRQVLFNVIQNAIEASPERGRILCSSGRDGEDLVVAVEDEGSGIAPEVAERLFESGFSTKSGPEMGGLGIGLFTCRSLLQSVGGAIDFQNRTPGPGARFTVRLPWQP